MGKIVKKINPFKVIERYNKGQSLRELAKHYDCSVNRVRNIIIKSGGTLRTLSEAQVNNLANGGKHPTKGRTRTDEEKLKISSSVKEGWDAGDFDKAARLKPMQEGLKKQRPEALAEAKKGLDETMYKGSKFEVYVFNKLKEDGFKVKMHQEHIMGNDHMHYDLFISSNKKIAIEIDGPTHQRPVFGDKRFSLQKEKDVRKNNLSITHNIHLLRVYADYVNLPLWKKEKIYLLIKEEIDKLNIDNEAKVVLIGKVD